MMRLGADHVVGRERSARRQRCALRGVQQSEDLRSCAVLEDDAAMRLVGIAARRGQEAAQGGTDLRHFRRSGVRFGGARRGRGPPPQARAQEALRPVDAVDGPLVARPRIGRESEESVLQQRRREIGAAKDEQGLSRLFLQLDDFLVHVVLHEPGVVPFRLL